ncbi:TPA: hypothetical protein DCZ15_02200 [Candidatus Falkowbacteria bacterium]|nr:MAG: Extracellular solute-binding protein, family 3 [Candidatus Falkowbacteria bacterium GW2011_GWF2_43_32]HBA36665.1 hypothetical protein [Candidatus Falkowbacteria bacterium]
MKIMWKQIGRAAFIVFSIVFLATFIFLAVYYFQNRPLNQSAIISGHPEWPPIMYQAGDKIVGAGPEIISRVLAELGLITDFKYVGSWDVAQAKTRSGEVDFLVAAYKTTERETYMDYSIPYTVDPIVLVVKKGKAFSYEVWSDLIGKKGVVTVGDSYGQQFDTYILENLTVQVVGTAEEAVGLLETEQADYFVYALYSAEKLMAEQQLVDRVEILPEYVSTENFYLTVSKKSPFVKYLPSIDYLLQQYAEDGTINEIIEHHKKLLWHETK